MSEAQLIPFEDVGDEVPVGRVLSVALGNPNWEDLEAALSRYAGDPALALFAYLRDGEAVGIVGTESGPTVGQDGAGVVHHLAVSPGPAASAIGAAMIGAIASRLGVRELGGIAFTTELAQFDACGFAIEALGAGEDGVERFRCTWSAG